MTVGQVIVVITLLANMYGRSPEQMQCIVYYESSFNPAATNGIHIGLGQYNPDTYAWWQSIAAQDASFPHRDIVAQNGPDDPVAALALMMWAFNRGYADHWQTLSLCQE